MARARCPSRDSRASYRADSWAGTAGRCGAGAAPTAGTARCDGHIFDSSRRHVALPQVARRTGGDDVDPGRVAAARARHEMVERQVVARAAILARETVAQKHVEPREGRVRRRLNEGLERYDARQLHLEARAAHRALVVGDDVHPLEKHRLDSVLPAPERQGVVAQRTKIRIQHQRRKASGDT